MYIVHVWVRNMTNNFFLEVLLLHVRVYHVLSTYLSFRLKKYSYTVITKNISIKFLNMSWEVGVARTPGQVRLHGSPAALNCKSLSWELTDNCQVTTQSLAWRHESNDDVLLDVTARYASQVHSMNCSFQAIHKFRFDCKNHHPLQRKHARHFLDA